MQRIKRFISFILTFIMVLSSIPVYAADVKRDNNVWSEAPGGHSGLGTVNNGSDLSSTGYKISLVFLPVDGLDQELTLEERRNKIDAAWKEAGPDDAIQIGKTIYLTTDKVRGGIAYGFPYNGFTYGLGARTGSKSRKGSNGYPNIEKIKDGTIVTPEMVNSVMDSLNLPSLGNAGSPNKYTAYSMKMNTTLPINIGNEKNGADLSYYFMWNRTDEEKEEDKDVIGTAYSKSTLAALVNYLATNAGTDPNEFIYFARIKDNNNNSVLYKHDSLVPEGANCFEQGRYHGNLGEYRVTIEPYWNVRILALGGAKAALTLRDFAFLFRSPQQSYKQVTIDQEPYYGDLGFSTRLFSNDIWGLTVTDRNEWENQGTTTITNNVEANKGGGLGFLTSSMMQMTVGSPGYIGSITNVFLPGALTDDNQNISVASMEYIGDKEKPEDVEPFMQQVASMIAGAASGIDFSADSNILDHNIAITRDAILNGTIKLPGINIDDIDNEASQEELIDQLDSLIDEYETTETGESAVGAEIKDMLRNELGIDVDNPAASSVNMQDFNLAVYVLARYGMTGLDIIDSEGGYTNAAADDNSDNDAYDFSENRARQPFILAALMNNESTRQAIEANTSENWDGPMSITKEDMRQTLGVPNKFSTHVLNDEADTQLQNNYDDSVTGIDSAIKDKVLDDVSNGGQITIVKDEYSEGMAEDFDVWNTMLDPPELEKGLLKRVPVAVGNTQLFFGAGTDLKQPVELPKGLIPTVVGGTLQKLFKNYVDVSKEADAINSYEGTTAMTQTASATVINAPQIANDNPRVVGMATGIAPEFGSLFNSINNTTVMPFTNSTSFDSSYRIGTGAFDEDKSIAINPFGMNTLINFSTMGLFHRIIPNTDGASGDTNQKWLGKLASQLYTANSKYAVPSGSDNSSGIFVAPTYSTAKILRDNPDATPEQIADDVIYKFTAMNPSTLIVNDAIFNNLPLGDDPANPSDETNSLLAASNYYLNRGLASDEATVKTNKAATLISEDDGSNQQSTTSNTTQLRGDYGISYVVYDAAIPVDIQFATEVDGQIVPLELASDVYDNTLISNVWYASPNLDKAVQLQKYYTVKDRKGKAHTLEVEEAVVKSATISEKDELKRFYDEYTKAYNNNDANMFTVSTTSKDGEDTQIYPRTRRTIFNKTSADKLNRGSYTKTHDTLAEIFRYLSASGEDLGLPTSRDNIVNSVYNTITITPSIYDKEAYLADPAANRLQVIVKVRALSDLVQYNMIQGLNGDYVEKVTPEIVDGKVNIENSLLTSTGTAERTPYDTDNPANNRNTGTQSSVFMLERDVDPNSERDDWTWEGFKNSKAETGKYRFLDDNNRPTQPEIDTQWMNPPILNLGGDDDTMEDSLEIPGGTRAIYVRYVENPPLYEIYRDKNGHETVRHRDKIVNEDGYIIASKGGTSDNLMHDGTPYYPVMAVAADINFDPPESNTVVDIKETTDTAGNVTTEAKLNEPANWDWVMKNVADYDINISGLSSSANPVKVAKNVTASGESALFDVQVVGVDGLYHKFVASGSPGDVGYDAGDDIHKGDRITLTQIETGRLGSADINDGRGFGYNHSTAPETFQTFENPPGNIEIVNKRFPNPGVTANTTSVLKPVFSNSEPYTDGVNASVSYPSEYVTDLPNYVIYILYVQDKTDNTATGGNDFYAILPQDMLTRAVAYKDLARQYYQKRQTLSNTAYNASFEKWYTLYMTIGSDKAYRVNKQTGEENGNVYIGSIYDTVEFERVGNPGSGEKVSFGPLARNVNNHHSKYNTWVGWYRHLYHPDPDDDIDVPDWFDQYDEQNSDNLEVDATTYSYHGDERESESDDSFGSAWYYVPNRCAGGEGPSDTISLFNDYTLNFGIQKQSTEYYNIGVITPMTVGITNPKFSSTANYIKRGIKLEKDTGEKYYWTDIFHYYNDYNFYVTVWRGNNKPTFAMAADFTEQSGIKEVQDKAIAELTPPINSVVTTLADGSTETQNEGFNVTKAWQPESSAPKNANYWQEDLYGANIYMGPDITDLHDPKDGALEEGEGKYNTFINSYAYGFTDGDLHDGSYLLPAHEDTYDSHGRKTRSASYRTFGQSTHLPDYANSQIQGTNTDNAINSFTAFHGYLMQQSLIDKAGVGAADPAPSNAPNTFSANGGAYYHDRDIQFSNTSSLIIPNQWVDSTGQVAAIWVNWYPWVKVRYQTVDSNMYYTPGAGGSTSTAGGTPLATKNAYVLSANQSTMKLNSAVEVGFNRGKRPDADQDYGGGINDPNRLTVQSTQWSTHQNALKNVAGKYDEFKPDPDHPERQVRDPKGTVLPGGAIYTLTLGAINADGYDAGVDAHLARSKVGIQYYKPYVPKSMENALVVTNRVGSRYASQTDAAHELGEAKDRYFIGQGEYVTQDPTFRGLVEALMQTINNTTVALHVEDVSNDAHENVYETTDKKYKLEKGDKADNVPNEYQIPIPLDNDSSTQALSGKTSAGNSASLDTLSFVQDTPIFCRIWSDTEGTVWFGWKESTTPPSLQEVWNTPSPGDAEGGHIPIVTAGQKIENLSTWTKAGTEPNEYYVYNDQTAAGGFPYKVDSSTRLITNYINATERAIGFTDMREDPSGLKSMPAGNGVDATHLQYNIPENYRKAEQSGSVYQHMHYGNETGTVTATNYNQLVQGFDAQGWNALTNELRTDISKYDVEPAKDPTPGTGIGYKWIEYNKSQGTAFKTESGWYNEASDGFGVVILRGIIEVGFGGPKPSTGVSGGTSAHEPVRTTIIDPEWQPGHTDRASLFTNFRQSYIYTEPDAQQHFYAKAYEDASGALASVTTGIPDSHHPAPPDKEGSGGVALGVQMDQRDESLQWLYLDEEGFGYLYRSKNFYIPNGSVMDLN